MEELIIRPPANQISISSRDVIAIAFRRKRLIVVTFGGILLGAALCALFLPREYKSTMQILVKRQRPDPVVTTQPDNMGAVVGSEITEEDMNTEVQLINSRDLLEQVVVACGLDKMPFLRARLFGTTRPELRVAMATDELERALTVAPVTKSDLIEVTYSASSPQLSHQVLSTLAELYMQKHTAVHREPGTADFFTRQAEQYQQAIAETQEQLKQSGGETGDGGRPYRTGPRCAESQ